MSFNMKTLKQFIGFGIVGFSNTVIGYLIYAVSLKALRYFGVFPKHDFYVAQFIMFILSVAWSFYWNNKYVFKAETDSERNILSALLKTYASYAFTCLFLSEALLFLWVRCLGINEFIAPVLNLLITVPLNFILQKTWTFKDGDNKDAIRK